MRPQTNVFIFNRESPGEKTLALISATRACARARVSTSHTRTHTRLVRCARAHIKRAIATVFQKAINLPIGGACAAVYTPREPFLCAAKKNSRRCNVVFSDLNLWIKNIFFSIFFANKDAHSNARIIVEGKVKKCVFEINPFILRNNINMYMDLSLEIAVNNRRQIRERCKLIYDDKLLRVNQRCSRR